MIRQSMIGSDYRLPNDGETEMSPGLILLMHMMAAGPAVTVPETLYLRWKRQGGLTASWRQLPFEMIVQGWQKELARTFLLVEEKVGGSDDQNVVKFALIPSTLCASSLLDAESRAVPCHWLPTSTPKLPI